MKKKMVLVMLLVMVISLAYVPLSYAGHGRHGGRGGGDAGLYAAGALLGGLVLGTVIGSAMSQPRYVASPQPVYAYPQPAYTAPAAYTADAPPGEWVVVPGRWVNGRWEPAHRVWMPVNPY